jgi:hypothetical protein
MSLKEQQQQTKSRAYAEAIRYMDNAKDVLRKANKEGDKRKRLFFLQNG